MSVRRALPYLVAGQYGGLVLQLVASAVIARLLTPEQVGVFSITFAAVALLQALRSFGVGNYLATETELTLERIRTCFALMLIVSWTLGAVLLLARHGLAAFYNRPEMAAIGAVLAANYFLAPFGQPAMALMMRELRLGTVNLIDLASHAAAGGVSIAFAYAGHGPISLAYGSVAATVVQTALALVVRPEHIALRPSLAEWRRVTAFGAKATGSAVFFTLGNHAPELIIGRLLSMADAGLYGRAFGTALLFNRLIVDVLSGALGPVLAAMRRERTGNLGATYLYSVSCLLGASWPFFVALIVLAEPLIVLLFGSQWTASAHLLQIVCLSRIIQSPASLSANVYFASGRVGLQLRIDAFVQVVSVALLLAAALHSIEAVAWSRVAQAGITTPVHVLTVRRVAGFTTNALMRAIAPSVLVLAFVAAWAAGFSMWRAGPAWSVLSVCVFLGGLSLAYVAALLAGRHPLTAEGRRLLAQLRRSRRPA